MFRYFVRGKGYTLEELKTAQDWILEREFRQVPGVIDVTSFGGLTRQYHVDVDPNRLRGHGVTLAQVQAALANANQNVGGQRVTVGEQSYTVRGVGLISIRIVPDRVRLARYGLNTGDVEAVVQAAVGGQVVTQVYEGEKHFDLVLRFLEPFRRDAGAIRRITVAAPDGSSIPLGEVAEIATEDGPAVIYREDGRRYTPVKFSVRGRDLASTIADSQARIAEQVKIPYGTHLEWAGEINQLEEAMGRLVIIIPITLLAIGLLVFLAVRDWVDFGLVFASILLASTGGFLALIVTGENFSVSAAMGFVSIFGVAIQSAILVVSHAQAKWAEGCGLVEGARLAGEERFRPVLMTTLVATLGLLPAALSTGIGAQAQKPLAIVVIGGSLALAALTRLLLPPLLVILHRRGAPGRAAATPGGPPAA